MKTATYTPRLQAKYQKDVVPALMKKFGYTYDDEGIKQFVYDRNKQFIDNTINTIIEKINNNER